MVTNQFTMQRLEKVEIVSEDITARVQTYEDACKNHE